MDIPAAPLDGFVVVDLSTGIAGGYCTKILADGGADVVKVEAPAGDPLRRWSASGAVLDAGEDGALFQFLAGAKRSVVVDPEQDSGREELDAVLAGADAVVWSPGSPVAAPASSAPAGILRDHPHLIVTAITAFGLDGPWSDRAATEFTLQAWSGGIIGLGRGDPERAPVFVGGQVGAWLAGAFAAVGTMVARRGGTGGGELVDVSMLEALSLCLTYYPVTYADALGRPFRSKRAVVTPGVAMAKDGMIAVGVGTGQQWLDFCAMVGHPEWMEDRSLFRERGHLAPFIDGWFADHTVDEIADLAGAFRLPHAVIATGASLPHLDHFAARGVFVPDPGGRFLRPRPPFQMHPPLVRRPGPAPGLGTSAAADVAGGPG
ncbi:MAG: CaiB/BaiF CoA transferase family protein, partial [Acidimicrobiales bacterium]